MSAFVNVETSLPPPEGANVPIRAGELSAAWLSACLQHAGVLAADASVRAFEVERIGQGRGFAGDILRVRLFYDYDAKDAGPASVGPRSLVAKFATEHAPTREMLSAVSGYEREVCFYRELASRVGISTPRCYFAHYDRARGRFCLLLEDLSPAQSVPREQGLSVEQAELVLEQLATMHARFWNRVDDIPWLTFDAELLDTIRSRFVAAVPHFQAVGARDYPTIARVATQLIELLQAGDLLHDMRRPPRTLAHSDLHLENVFLPSAAGGRFAVIDWQSVSAVRHGASDVARVLCVGLRPELRRAHDKRLLRHYHRVLVQHGVRGYSLRRLSLRVRQELVSTVLLAVMAFATLEFGPEGQRTADLFASRVESALADAKLSWLLYALTRWKRVTRRLRALLQSVRPRPRLPK